MTPRTRIATALTLAALVLTGFTLESSAKEIPLDLPKPDGKPGDASKPVKVYILSGQSNMVGMGDITGARPLYPSVFLSADPAIIPGIMPIGGSALASHGVYQSADPKAEKGAVVSVYEGKYDAAIEYAKLTPSTTGTLALGTLSVSLPTMEGPYTVVATAWIDVPATGIYTLHPGFGQSTQAIVSLNGKEVYRKTVAGKPECAKVDLEKGKRYPIKIIYLKDGSAAFWMEQIGIEGKGDLNTVTKKDNKFTYLIDDAGKWTERNDVYYQEARLTPGGRGSPLSAASNNGKSIGPELGFGFVMGAFHDEQVLLIKTAQGNRSLGFDFRPPSSGRAEPKDENEGLEYRLTVQGVRETLKKIDKIVPGYKEQGYEIAGFAWFQGHKDSGSTKEEYEKNLVNLINDLRKEFQVPKMPVVIATVGFHGYSLLQGSWKGVWEAQMAVGDPKQHPEFAGTVATVDTRDFWREVEESPREQDYHYNRNAETYMLVGEAMGRAMVRLQGGEAAAIPKSNREALFAAQEGTLPEKPEWTDAQKAASLAAVKPMVLDGVVAAFMGNPDFRPLLLAEAKGEKPVRASPLLGDTLDKVADFYRAAGINDYDWKPFGPDMANASWDYYSFNLPESQDKVLEKSADTSKNKKRKSTEYHEVKVIYPTGTENWFARDFDTTKGGWKSGAAPFGQLDDKANLPGWMPHCRVPPKTLCEKDVLLLRQSFDLAPLDPGHRYRIRIAGSAHVNMGEGYAIYVNGKLLAECKGGVVAWRKEGNKPRGSHIWADWRDELKGGKVTLAVANFPMDNKPTESVLPHRAHLSVWMEEMKIPPLE